MSKVKLFDLNRLARFQDQMGGDVYVVPRDLMAIYHNASACTLLMNGSDEGVFLAKGTTLEDIEAEINRAIETTNSAANEYADESAKEITDKLIQLKATIKGADAFSMNDFYPDLDKDKKGFN